MAIKINPLKCINCGTCEFACNYHWDVSLSSLASSIMVHRVEEKSNYFGVMLRMGASLILGRPEGVEAKNIKELIKGEKGEGGASSKPILLRKSCNLCDGSEDYQCVRFCPTGSLEREGG
jgi:Fe-S-cluster-containing dehydrogenase component